MAARGSPDILWPKSDIRGVRLLDFVLQRFSPQRPGTDDAQNDQRQKLRALQLTIGPSSAGRRDAHARLHVPLPCHPSVKRRSGRGTAGSVRVGLDAGGE
jgi:hypothetical protein